MKLIVESGSSKTDWRVLENQTEITQTQTIGFNPYDHTSEEMISALKESELVNFKENITEVYFYGAGCGTPAMIKGMKNTLHQFFQNAQIQVYDDLLAVGKGLCQDKQGIVGILGTGSNVGFYNGQKMVSADSSLGYMLGNEGGASYLGKIVLKQYILKQLPQHLQEKFITKFGHLSRGEILDNIYKKSFVSRYLGSFAPFLSENIKEDFCQKIVSEGFQKLIQNYITLIPEYKAYPLYFVGSVAVAFENILRKVFKDNHLEIQKIAKNPIEGLVEYHKT